MPGLQGPPNWYGPPATPADRAGSFPKLDDPRWAGSPLVNFANALGAGEAEYRVVAQGDYLYLSYHALTGTMVAGENSTWFGFSKGPALGDDAFLVRVDAATSGTGAISTTIAQVDRWNATTAAWEFAIPASDYAWIEQSHTWLGAPGVDWAVNLKIKAKGAGSAGIGTGNVNVFFGMGWDLANAGAVEYSTPDLSLFAGQFVNAFTRVPKEHTAWVVATQPGTACPDGVTIDAYDIQTTHPNGSSMYTGTPAGDPDINSFLVKPKHVRGRIPQLPHTVRVRLSVADWGAQVANPTASQWNPVYGTRTFMNDAGTWTWAWDTTAPAGPAPAAFDNVTIGFTCAKEGANPFCPMLENIPVLAADKLKARHQCVLAELRGDPNATNSNHLTFTKAAAYRNMDFVSLSTFEREAEVSIKGLERVTGKKQDRDVYLYVHRRNMPTHSERAMELARGDMLKLKQFALNPPPAPFTRDPKDEDPERKRAAAQLPHKRPSGGRDNGIEALRYQAALESLPPQYSSASRHELLSAVWPVYTVHAYYDTGAVRTVGGVTKKVLHPLVPFGYLLDHEGLLYGFSDSLEALGGATLEELAPDVYRVRVASEGSIRIKSVITAHEAPPSPGSGGTPCCANCKPPVVNVNVRGCHCRTVGAPGTSKGGVLLLLGVLPLGALAFTRRRSRRRRQGESTRHDRDLV